jgi:hypothetical protein
MKKKQRITGEEFCQKIMNDPLWCRKIKEPIIVTTPVELSNAEILSLSPLLTFEGVNEYGCCASFEETAIDVATGTFHGSVSFSFSEIEKIEKLHILNPSKKGEAAFFNNCQNLKEATGIYTGKVEFENCYKLEKINNLSITQGDKHNRAASFFGCITLKVAEGTFYGSVDFSKTGVEKIGELFIERADNMGGAAGFSHCQRLKKISGKFPGGVDLSYSSIEEIENLIISTDGEKEKAWLLDIRGTKNLKCIQKDLDPRNPRNDLGRGGMERGKNGGENNKPEKILHDKESLEKLEKIEKLKKKIEEKIAGDIIL